MLDLIFSVVGHKESNSVRSTVRLSKNVLNNHHGGMTGGPPNVMEQLMNIEMPHLIMDPANGHDKVALNENHHNSQLLTNTDNTSLKTARSSTLGTEDSKKSEPPTANTFGP